MEDRTAPESATRLHYVERGTGEPMLLIHGFGASLYTWRHIIDELAENHRVIAIDLKGFGDSPKPFDDDYAIQDQVALVEAFILAHDLRNLTIIGHSFGGGVALLTALAFARKHDDRVAKLVAIDNVAYPQSFPFFIKALRVPIFGPLGAFLLPARMQARQVLELCYHDPKKITADQVERYAVPIRTPGGRHALVRTARRILPANFDEITATYPTLNVPTLLIWGRHDRVIPLSIGERLVRDLPRAELAIIENAGHIPHEETPAETMTHLRRWLGQG